MDAHFATNAPPHELLRTAFLIGCAQPDWLVTAAMRWLEDNPRAAMTELHEGLGISPAALNRRCKQHGWPPPIKLRKMLNVVRGMELYLTEQVSLADAAASVGYDMTWLSNACAEETGFRPSAYRDEGYDVIRVATRVVAHWIEQGRS